MTIRSFTLPQQDISSLKDLNIYRSQAEGRQIGFAGQMPLFCHNQTTLTYQDGTLVVDSIALPLARRPLGNRLVRAFFTKNEQYLDRDALLMSVYGKSMSSVSVRQAASLHSSLCKLISRTRRYLIALSAAYPQLSNQDWLSYCHRQRKWYLIR